MPIFRKIRSLILMIIPAILWISYSNTANWHLHELEYGFLSSHDHAYERSANSDKPIQDHKHNSREMILLNQVFEFLFISFSLIIISFAIRQPFNFLTAKTLEIHVNKTPGKLVTVRGPPPVWFSKY